MTEAVSFFMQHVYWADGEWRMHAWSWLWCQPNRKLVTFSPVHTFWQTCFALCGMFTFVHCTSNFQFDSKVMAPISWFKGQLCGGSMWRLNGAHMFRTLNVRMSAEMGVVCLFAFMQAGAVCLFVCLFVCLPSHKVTSSVFLCWWKTNILI